MNITFKLAVLTLALCATVSAQAYDYVQTVPFIPGWLGGTLLASTSTVYGQPELPLGTTWSETVSGTFRSAVYEEKATGTLDFYYQFQNAGANEGKALPLLIFNIPAMSANGYFLQTNAAFGDFAAGDAKATSLVASPIYIKGAYTGDVSSTLNFASSAAGESTYTLLFRSYLQRLNYENGLPTYGVSGTHLNGDSYFTEAIVATVPEPETYAMLLAGLVMIGGIVRCRKTKQD